ncbi:PadR family transcriptional regulator, partial [Streptomyces sp. SID13726]|uniref:PadR family transcriptional regulator n=2 Tax=unclassified Streptomyces TaxID=2593676 RepID=UPI0013BA28D0
MALEHAILVSLLEKPGSGYELARRFDRSIGYFWTATHQQIYRVLKRMETDGLLAVREVAQQGRPDKKEYSVADPGRTALSDWLHEPIEPESLRHDLAVKIRGAAFDDPAALILEVE